MLNKLYIYPLFNILKFNVPHPTFVTNQPPIHPHSTFVPHLPHAEISMDNPALFNCQAYFTPQKRTILRSI